MNRLISSVSNRRITTALVATAAALTLSACATHQSTQSGFLSDYATVGAPSSSTKAYTAAMIDPVEFRPTGRTPAHVEPADVAALTRDYQTELETAFSRRFTLVNQPGPNVMRVRAAITGYTFANPVWNALSLAVPIGPRNGGISTEAEVVDSVTGERVVAQSESFNGHVWNSSPTAMFDRDGHAHSGFRNHARRLADEVLVDGGDETRETVQ